MGFLQHEVLLRPLRTRLVALLWRGLLIVLFGFLALTAYRAIVASVDNNGFPNALALKVEALPIIFPLHMVMGGLALILAPLAIFMRRTRWHKTAGRSTAAVVFLSGVTAFPVALVDPVTAVSAAGFSAQAATWLGLLGAGLWFIRHGRVKQHQACMLMMTAVTSGAVFFRIALAVWGQVGPPAYFWTFYAIDAWLAWALPLAVTASAIKIYNGKAKRPVLAPE
jgi:uncharacterized membrane protein YozB (DUF420 family)